MISHGLLKSYIQVEYRYKSLIFSLKCGLISLKWLKYFVVIHLLQGEVPAVKT